MDRRSRYVFMGAGILSGALLVFSSSMAGCQSNDTSTSASANGGSGATGGSNSTSTNSNAGGGGSVSTSTSTNTNSGGGPGAGGSGGFTCDSSQSTTITKIADGTLGPDIVVDVTGIVATSRKFLVSGPGSSGSCLWGVFVSEPIAAAAEYSGTLLISYGAQAQTTDSGAGPFCPTLNFGSEPTGDLIPDDVAPGDVLDVKGAKTASFLLSQCATEPGGTSVPQVQLTANSPSCSSIKKNGTATPPTPKDMTSDLDNLAKQSDATFHNKWSGVKVRVTNVTATVQDGDPNTSGVQPSITDGYGNIVLEGSPGLTISDKMYYQGLLKSLGATCHQGPTYTDPATAFDSIDGFYMINYCTWGLFPDFKCVDFVPGGTDCPCQEEAN